MDERRPLTLLGYRALLGELQTVDKKDWVALWKYMVPPKVKTFMWQACSSCLPNDDILIAKKVDCDPVYPLCSNAY